MNTAMYNIKKCLFIIHIALFIFISCDFKDPIYYTDHPKYGKITLKTDWTDRTNGIDIPMNYMVKAGDYLATVSGELNTIDNLFEPDSYRLHIYNSAESIAVNGIIASADYTSGTLGWFFSCAMDAMIEKDKVCQYTAAMHQQVRILTLVIEPESEDAKIIEGITASLSGVAATFNMENSIHGTATNIELNFTKMTGIDAGKWSATVRLLGVTGSEQKLSGSIAFTHGNPSIIPLESDMTIALANFNTDKKTPLILGGEMIETPTGIGIGTPTINGWKEQDIIDGETE